LPVASRRAVAMELLRSGDQRGLPDTVALLQDESVVNWQRANAARALEYTRSLQARLVLESLANKASDDELHRVACEVLAKLPKSSP